MKFASASLVLAAMAIESVSAGTIRHGHKHAHVKKAEEAKRAPDYAWTPPAGYDWHTDDGKKWNYNPNTQAAPAAPAATPASNPSPAASPAADTYTAPTSNDDSKSDDSKGNDAIGGIVGEVKKVTGTAMANLKSLISGAHLDLSNKKNLGYLGAGQCKAGINAQSSGTSFAWLGASDDAEVVNTMINESDDDITVVMWELGGYTGMWVQKEAPAIAVKIPSGQSIEVSHGIAKGAWAAIYPDTAFSWTGLIHNVFGECNFGVPFATFDVSKIPAASGNPMTITDGTCTSSSKSNKCLYECKSFQDSKGGDWCETDYHLTNLEGVDGCHVGADANQGGADGGGCMLKGKKITTTFH